MTTNKQLREWLSRFPDDALINVITSEESYFCYQTNVAASVQPMQLPDVQIEQLTWQDEFSTVQFDVTYDYDKECNDGVKSITLGRHHND